MMVQAIVLSTCAALATIVLAALKLIGMPISWWLVMAPMWGMWAVGLAAFLAGALLLALILVLDTLADRRPQP